MAAASQWDSRPQSPPPRLEWPWRWVLAQSRVHAAITTAGLGDPFCHPTKKPSPPGDDPAQGDHGCAPCPRRFACSGRFKEMESHLALRVRLLSRSRMLSGLTRVAACVRASCLSVAGRKRRHLLDAQMSESRAPSQGLRGHRARRPAAGQAGSPSATACLWDESPSVLDRLQSIKPGKTACDKKAQTCNVRSS